MRLLRSFLIPISRFSIFGPNSFLRFSVTCFSRLALPVDISALIDSNSFLLCLSCFLALDSILSILDPIVSIFSDWFSSFLSILSILVQNSFMNAENESSAFFSLGYLLHALAVLLRFD